MRPDQYLALKVQYPEVKKSIKTQIGFLKIAAASAKFSPMAKWNMSTSAHISQIETRLNEELDYKQELKNLLKRQSLNDSSKKITEFNVEKYCTSQIFVQPWIEGTDLTSVKTSWSFENRKLSAEMLVENYLKQIFKDKFFQGDTNFSNFIFQLDEKKGTVINIEWIDFGNWCSLSTEVQQSLFALIMQTINGEEINYLGHFERIGFDLSKLRYFENSLPVLVSILFEPFLKDEPFNLAAWTLEADINNL